MRVSEIRVKRIRVNQGLGVGEITNGYKIIPNMCKIPWVEYERATIDPTQGALLSSCIEYIGTYWEQSSANGQTWAHIYL